MFRYHQRTLIAGGKIPIAETQEKGCVEFQQEECTEEDDTAMIMETELEESDKESAKDNCQSYCGSCGYEENREDYYPNPVLKKWLKLGDVIV